MAYMNTRIITSSSDDDSNSWTMFRDLSEKHQERAHTSYQCSVAQDGMNKANNDGAYIKGYLTDPCCKEEKSGVPRNSCVNDNANAYNVVYSGQVQPCHQKYVYSNIVQRFFSPEFDQPEETKRLRDIQDNGANKPPHHSLNNNVETDIDSRCGRYLKSHTKSFSKTYRDAACSSAAEETPITCQLPVEFPQDLGSCVDGHKCRNAECECRFNKWSQFSPDYGKSLETRQRDKRDTTRNDDTCYSEKSCYSTDSSSDNSGYDIIDWAQEYGDIYHYRGSCGSVPKQGKECDGKDIFGTPPSSPLLDLSALDRYHTAPNSPRSVSLDYCIVDIPSTVKWSEEGSVPVGYKSKMSDAGNIQHSSTQDTSNVLHENQKNDNAAVHMDYDSTSTSALDTFTDSLSASLKDAETQPNTQTHMQNMSSSYRQTFKSDPVIMIPKLKTPPFISVDCIQYEADPKTGAVKTVGKGSFGQVFKARFADPTFHHLSIVVKEFDEEFTSRQEILQEAQRLLYLNGTGYVPVCYGLVCLGDPKAPTYGIIQEYVGSGLTLEQLLWDQYDLPLGVWLSVAVQCCDGLSQFHEKGILLNDIKSNNIILDFDEHLVRIKYIDFGLATDMRGKRYKNTKSLNDFVYLAPEVRMNGHVTNIQTDIYSLGYMLDQINTFAGVPELKFVANLCMDSDPDARLPVRAASSLIYDHMIYFGIYDKSHYGNLPTHQT